MRKMGAALTALSLVVAACTDDSTSTTSEQEQETTSPQTTGQAGPIPDLVCPVSAPDSGLAGDVLCADHLSQLDAHIEEPTPDNSIVRSFPDALADDGSPAQQSEVDVFQTDDHMCLLVPGQLFVWPVPEGLLLPGLSEVTQFGLEEDESFADYLDSMLLGLYEATDGRSVFEHIAELEQRGFIASPHYYLAPNQTWKYGPANEPQTQELMWADLEPVAGRGEGTGRVLIIDSGGVQSAVLGINGAEAEPLGLAPTIAGHGQFAASMVNRYNQDLAIEIYSASAAVEDGKTLLSEATVVAAIGRSQPTSTGPEDFDVVNLSLGTYPCSDQDLPLGLILGVAVMPHEIQGGDDEIAEVLVDLASHVSVVAAAGNDEAGIAMFPARLGEGDYTGLVGISDPEMLQESLDQLDCDCLVPMIPEGFEDAVRRLSDRVTSVGALAKPEQTDDEPPGNEAEIADWSNPGEVYAPGEALLGWYEHGSWEIASWSGTSFAAPRYAACVASGECVPPR